MTEGHAIAGTGASHPSGDVSRRRFIRSAGLTVAMLAFRSQTQRGLPDYTGLMAGTLISILPMIGLFLVFGRKIVDSIQFQGYR